ARFLQSGLDVVVHAVGLAGNGERGEARLQVVRRQWLDRPDAGSHRLGDLLGVPARPDARAVDAPAAPVDVDAVAHDVDVLLPLIDLVVAQQDLAEPRAVGLDPRVALVLLDGRGAAKNQAARALLEHRGADVAQTGVDGDGLPRHAGLDERGGHAVGRPGLLRA